MAGINTKEKSFFNKRSKEFESAISLRDGGKERVKLESPTFLKNGGLLMEKLTSLSKGRQEIHIKRFTMQEIDNNFMELFKDCDNYKLFKGNLDGRPVLVQYILTPSDPHDVAFGTAISALMSHLKYSLNLIGCCTDYQLPAPVYEFAGTATLTDMLGEDRSGTLSWGHRVKIARDVAATVLYLHTSFPLPIIYRDLKPDNVLIEQNGDAKLFDFSLSIEVPAGESEVEDIVIGTFWFLDPEYLLKNRLSTKSDVYSFGVILLMLLTGKRQPFYRNEEGDEIEMFIHQYFEQFMDDDAKLIDRNIAQGVRMDEFQAMKDLALSCTQEIGDNRPEMIDVARRLHAIEKLVNKPSCRILHPS